MLLNRRILRLYDCEMLRRAGARQGHGCHAENEEEPTGSNFERIQSVSNVLILLISALPRIPWEKKSFVLWSLVI